MTSQVERLRVLPGVTPKPLKKKSRLRFPGRDLLEYGAVRFLGFFFWALPLNAAQSLARMLGRLGYRVLSKRRQVALNNIELAYGAKLNAAEKSKIARSVFESLAISMMELFMTMKMRRGARQRFAFQGVEYLEAAFRRGRGVVFVISHLGSWEYLAFLPFLKGFQCSVIAKPLRNPYLYRWIHACREATGLHNIDKDQSLRRILKELKENHLVAILIDQWAGPEGIATDFFGTSTSTTSMPVRLAQRTGAALIPGYCIRMPGGKYEIQIQPEQPIRAGADWERATTEALNRRLEEQICRYPDQWIWSHRRWKPLPDALR